MTMHSPESPQPPSAPQPPPAPQFKPVQAPVVSQTSHPAQTAPVDADNDVLDEVESLLIRMLIGTIRFPFIWLPRNIYKLCKSLFPTAVRVFRICGLAALLAGIILFPGLYAIFFHQTNACLADRVPTELLQMSIDQSTLTRLVCGTWSILAFTGAVWGAIYIRRKRKATTPCS